MVENKITGQIIDAAMEVHRTLGGPGLLESVYEEALAWETDGDVFQVRAFFAFGRDKSRPYMATTTL